jgi:hypothetical protein
MKQLIIRYCVVLGIATIMWSSYAQAQSFPSASSFKLKAGTSIAGTGIHLGSGTATSVTNSGTKPASSLFSPLDATPFKLSYYDTTVDSTDWVGGQSYGSFVFVSLGERFTLPGNSGFVDSVTLQIDAISSGSIVVSLVKDTLVALGGIYYHLMSLDGIHALSDFDGVGYAVQTVQADSLQPGAPVTVHFPHVAVPQSFFVAVVPDVSSGRFANAYLWRGDHKISGSFTPDNTHSAYIALTSNGQVFPGLLDSAFTDMQGNHIYTNFYATLYGSSGSSGVPIQLSSAHEAALYPNPATTVLNIPASMQASDFELRDILGRTVLHSSQKNPEHIDVRSLASGDYVALIHTASGIVTTPVMIAR